MAITDPFDITHGGKTRTVDVQQFTIGTPTGGDLFMFVAAETWLPTGSEIDQQQSRLRDAQFDQAETVAAFMAQSASMSLGLTAQQIGQLVTGAVEQAIRTRFEDA